MSINDAACQTLERHVKPGRNLGITGPPIFRQNSISWLNVPSFFYIEIDWTETADQFSPSSPVRLTSLRHYALSVPGQSL